MKIKCNQIIHSSSGKDLGAKSPWLTVGKEYIVLAIRKAKHSTKVIIQSDHYREPIMGSLNGFEVISEYEPTTWVRWDLDDDAYWLLPESWKYYSFFNDVEDEEPKAVEIFNKEAKEIYRQEEEHEKSNGE